MVYNRISLGILRYGPDRTGLDKRAYMVVGTNYFIYLYHSCIIWHKFISTPLFHKIDFIYICIYLINIGNL